MEYHHSISAGTPTLNQTPKASHQVEVYGIMTLPSHELNLKRQPINRWEDFYTNESHTSQGEANGRSLNRFL